MVIVFLEYFFYSFVHTTALAEEKLSWHPLFEIVCMVPHRSGENHWRKCNLPFYIVIVGK
jgi:hypothetical protein